VPKAEIDLDYLYEIYCDETGEKPTKVEFAEMVTDFVEQEIRDGNKLY